MDDWRECPYLFEKKKPYWLDFVPLSAPDGRGKKKYVCILGEGFRTPCKKENCKLRYQEGKTDGQKEEKEK